MSLWGGEVLGRSWRLVSDTNLDRVLTLPSADSHDQVFA